MAQAIATGVVAGVFLLSMSSGALAQLGGGRTINSAPSRQGTTATVNCTVGSVMARVSRFGCGGQSFQVTSSTGFSGTSLSQLHTGMAVQVQYHTSGAGLVADSVTAR